MHGKIVGAGLADGGREDLDDPEDRRDFRDLVEQLGQLRVAMAVAGTWYLLWELRGCSKAMPDHAELDLGCGLGEECLG